MDKILEIKLELKNEIATCDFIELDPYAVTTGRMFRFKGLQFENNIFPDTNIITGLETITVYIFCDKDIIFQFDIFLIDCGFPLGKGWWVYGLVRNDCNQEYRQGVVDILYLWGQGKALDWESLPVGSYLKKDYLKACLHFSSVSTKYLDKDVYQIDMTWITEDEEDFIYLASKEFFGDKGYMGHNFYSFEDCLLILFEHRGYFPDKTIRFLGTSKILKTRRPFYEEIKETFSKYKFLIEEVY